MLSFDEASPDIYGSLKYYARENRKNMTLAETILWDKIKRKQLGYSFLRQYIIGDYIVDFVCREGGLIIEVDGGYHSEPRQSEDDCVREKWLESKGYHVMRFSNEEVLYETDKVIETIGNWFNN